MIERAGTDPVFAEELVRDLLKLQEENRTLKDEVMQVKKTEQAAQQALRQARGISSYLKGKQGELKKTEGKTQLALRQANGISSFLKSKNESLEQRLKNAEQIEMEAQQALRQARGISAYLKSKNASLEKKLAAAKTEKSAESAFRQAQQSTVNLRSSLKGSTITAADLTLALTDDDDSSQEHEPVQVTKTQNDEADEFEELSLTNKLGMVSLVLIGVAMAMKV
eukprot:scaffold8828_cov204-Amphora_coffeaeformis.AAC.23